VGMTPTVDPDTAGVRAQRLVAMCRKSGVQTTRTPPNHFADSEDLFALDTQGDISQLDFECPPTLAEMLAIAHEYQGNRAAALAEIQKTYDSTHTPRPKPRANYNMFCSPRTESEVPSTPLTTVPSNQYNQFCTPLVLTSNTNNDTRDIFADTDSD
jgi:hypothetical protein